MQESREFEFIYRDEIQITVQANSEEEARHAIEVLDDKVKVSIIGPLHADMLELMED